MTYLRTAPHHLSLFAALALLPACPQTSADDGADGDGDTETGGDGDAQVCIDPGTELLPDAKPATVPGANASNFTCGTGWGTDAPQRDPAWTIQLGEPAGGWSFSETVIAAHPEGGVVVATTGLFGRYDADGEPLWTADSGAGFEAQYSLVVEDAGTIVLASYDWMVDQLTLTRYDADGNLLGPIDVPWNAPQASIWALDTFGTDLVIGAVDADSEGAYETTLLRLDAMGNEVLRKSTNMTGGQLLAANTGGAVAFGNFPCFLVSLEDGAVLGNLAPSTGNPRDVAGSGDDFMMTGNSGDFVIGRYSSAGTERWLQTYDRAGLGDQGAGIAAAADGTMVAVGSTQLLDSFDSWWGTQPIVFAVDGDGNALWSDRISAHGEASTVSIGSGGEVYVAGFAELDVPIGEDGPTVLSWLRRYSL